MRQEHRYTGAVYHTDGALGRIVRRPWLIDPLTDAPAVCAYIVRFDDGRELCCDEDELRPVEVEMPASAA